MAFMDTEDKSWWLGNLGGADRETFMAVQKHFFVGGRKLHRIFKRAIESERQAQVMYSEAIQLCKSKVLRDILQAMHDDEVAHEARLLEFYSELRQSD